MQQQNQQRQAAPFLDYKLAKDLLEAQEEAGAHPEGCRGQLYPYHPRTCQAVKIPTMKIYTNKTYQLGNHRQTRKNQ